MLCQISKIKINFNYLKCDAQKTFKDDIIKLFGFIKEKIIQVISYAKIYISTNFIVLGVLALLNFKWAGLGILAAVISTIILLYILYYIKRYNSSIESHFKLILESMFAPITKYLLPYIEIITYTVIFILYVYIAIFVNIILAFILNIILYLFLISILLMILYELIMKYYNKLEEVK